VFCKCKFIALVSLLGLLGVGAACKKSNPPPASTDAEKAQARAQTESKAAELLPQPSDITPDVVQFNWNWTREDAAKVVAKKNITPHRFQKQYMEWDSAFEGYPGRVLMVFGEEGEEEGIKLLRQIQLFIFPKDAKGDAAKQRQELFDFWDKKLTQRYGANFKQEETGRTKSHIWQLRPDFKLEIRLVTAADTKPQLGIYWQIIDSAEDKDKEKGPANTEDKDADPDAKKSDTDKK
jgi:hypothetical protein